MAIIQEAAITQSTREVRGWTVDFTDDLPTGVTVSSATAVHVPPSGDAATPTLSNTTTTATATIGTLDVTGVHYIDILATFSNNEKSEVRITFTVNFPSTLAREGMLSIINRLRPMVAAGANDYSIAGEPFWADAQLQTVLDRNRLNVIHEELKYTIEYTGGVPFYKRYFSEYGNYESGTAVFYVEDSAGNLAGTALYTPDYQNGEISFVDDTSGTVYYLTGRSYDLHAAAAEIWSMKASHYAEAYDFSTDGHSLKRGQLIQNCFQMARYHEQNRRTANESIDMERSDLNAWNY